MTAFETKASFTARDLINTNVSHRCHIYQIESPRHHLVSTLAFLCHCRLAQVPPFPFVSFHHTQSTTRIIQLPPHSLNNLSSFFFPSSATSALFRVFLPGLDQHIQIMTVPLDQFGNQKSSEDDHSKIRALKQSLSLLYLSASLFFLSLYLYMCTYVCVK